jgi:hypothetical protein
MRNLRTSAFANWSDTQKENEAKVFVSITESRCAKGLRFLAICMTDNGPLHKGGERGNGEHGRALGEIAVVVERFGGKLEPPVEINGFTEIKLLLHQRILETPQ